MECDVRMIYYLVKDDHITGVYVVIIPMYYFTWIFQYFWKNEHGHTIRRDAPSQNLQLTPPSEELYLRTCTYYILNILSIRLLHSYIPAQLRKYPNEIDSIELSNIQIDYTQNLSLGSHPHN